MTAPASGRVVVVGSANVDLTVTVSALPRPGQTVMASKLDRRCGGKGANQAAAAGLLGGRVRLLAAVGDDEAGEAIRVAAEAAGVHTDRMPTLPGSTTGTALITVDQTGENSIVVAPGANAKLDRGHLDAALGDLRAGDVLLASLEIALDTAAAALRHGRERGAITMLNPSPFSAAVADLLPWVDVVIVNEGEAAELGPDALARPGLAVIVTLGADGARVRPAGDTADPSGVDPRTGSPSPAGPSTGSLSTGSLSPAGPSTGSLSTGAAWHAIAAPAVEVVDTTGCGDAFAGAVATELAAGVDLVTATTLAVRYAALVATAPGAQSSYMDRATFEASGLG